MIPQQSSASDFDAVALGSFLKSSCSPTFSDRKSVGLLIRMPEQVTIPADGTGRLPLCLTAQLKAAEVVGYRNLFQAANVVLVDDENGESFTASLWKDRTFRDAPRPEMTADEMEVVTMTKYYNANVLDHVALPRRNAKYHVYVVLNSHQSNSCSIQVVSK